MVCGQYGSLNNMAKMYKAVLEHETIKKGTSIGRKPNTSTMNKNKRRSLKSYRGQGKWAVNLLTK